MAILLRTIRRFIPLSETKYNGSGQDTMIFASCTEYTRLMSETIVLSNFHVFLISKGTYWETQNSLNASLPEGVHWSLGNWKVHCAPGVRDSNLKNLWCVPLKAARPGQFHGSLQEMKCTGMLTFPHICQCEVVLSSYTAGSAILLFLLVLVCWGAIQNFY